MSIDSSVNIPGRGTVVTGTVEQGKCKVGDEVHMIGIKRKPSPTTITGIEMFHQILEEAHAGDQLGALVISNKMHLFFKKNANCFSHLRSEV